MEEYKKEMLMVSDILFKNNVPVEEAKPIGAFIEKLIEENQQKENKQKEFIEYLENEIKYWEEQEQQWIKLGFMKFGGEANNKIIFKKVLSKYKEIVGGKEWDKD